MPGKLGTGAGITVGWFAVALDNALDPDSRAQHDHHNDDNEEQNDHSANLTAFRT